jgi:peroxiredoxin Q/BCP
MKRAHLLAALGFCAMGFGASLSTAQAEDKAVAKEGEKAPDFKLKGSDGKEYSLKQFAGKQAVVIAWFPKAFTGG